MLLPVSVAVRLCVPLVLNVTVKVCVPLSAAGEGVVGRQDGLRIRAGEMDRAGVAGGDVAVGSWAVTVNLPARPAVNDDGKPATISVLAAAGSTVMPASVPLSMQPFAVSVAVSDWTPAVLKVAPKLPVPLVRVMLAGSTARASLLVKWTVPL